MTTAELQKNFQSGRHLWLERVFIAHCMSLGLCLVFTSIGPASGFLQACQTILYSSLKLFCVLNNKNLVCCLLWTNLRLLQCWCRGRRLVELAFVTVTHVRLCLVSHWFAKRPQNHFGPNSERTGQHSYGFTRANLT